MFKKIFLALFIGLISAVMFVQNDQWVHDYVAKNFKAIFEQSFDCSIDFKVSQVNVFGPRLELRDVHVRPKQKIEDANPIQKPNWAWRCKTMTLSVSWLSMLGGLLGLHIDIADIVGHSNITDGRIALWQEHVTKLIHGPSTSMPFFLKSLTFKNGKLHIKDAQSTIDYTIHWRSESKKIDDLFKTNIYIEDGSLALYKKSIIDHMRGEVSFEAASLPEGFSISSRAHCNAELHALHSDKRTVYISGIWAHDHGMYSIKSADKTWNIDPIKVTLHEGALHVDAQAHMPLTTALHILDNSKKELPITGDCNITMQGVLNPSLNSLHGNCTIENIKYGSVKICKEARLSFNKEGTLYKGNIALECAPLIALKGSWQWDVASGSITLGNDTISSIPGLNTWHVLPKDLRMHIDVQEDFSASGAIRCTAKNAAQEKDINVDGAIIIDANRIACKGHIQKNGYDVTAVLEPKVHIKSLHYNDEHGNPLISMEANKEDVEQFDGLVQFSFMRSLVQYLCNYNLQGEGTFKINGKKNDTTLQLQTKLEQGTIRLPETYNFINGFDAHMHIDMAQKKVLLDSMKCALHRGSCSIEHAVAQFDDQGALTYGFLPLILDSCVLNFKKDLFAVLSGSLNITKQTGQLPFLKGHVFIERAQLKENFLSDQFQRNLFAYAGSFVDTKADDMLCDITIESKQPLRIETTLCQATAKIGVHIQNSIRDPKVSGSIELLSGSLNFPYRPLTISKCSLYFMPGQLYDPLIELVAKSKIKKYSVTMEVTGSLLNPDISLESVPALTEEQIIALLLIGSPEESLGTMIPALLVQNLKTVLFESEQSPFKVDSLHWLKPFKNIHLVPSFSDQTARGGLRGALEIDFSDRLRASAQKNFSLSEDTRFEVEYQVSDDIAVRGIRDERKDVGGEIEMRWKFGG